MKFDIGDLVRVRDWDDMEREFGMLNGATNAINTNCAFVKGMKRFCGQTFHVTWREQSGWAYRYHLDGAGKWYFSEDTLIPLQTKAAADDVVEIESEDTFLQFLQ